MTKWFVIAIALVGISKPTVAEVIDGVWKIGEVVQVLVNPEGRRDALLVTETNTKKLAVVKVPPHLWTADVSISPGDAVEFVGRQILSSPNFVFDRAVVKKGALTLDDSRMSATGNKRIAPSLMPQGGTLQQTSIDGPVLAVSADPTGHIDRVILADGSSANIPPDLTEGHPFRPRVGERFTVAGIGGTFDGKKSVRAQNLGLAE
jgi:hypothetical protein